MNAPVRRRWRFPIVAALTIGGAVSVVTGAAAGPRPDPPAPARAGGRIEGTVTISQKLVARRPLFRIYADAGPGSQPPPAARPDSITELRNIVVYVDGDQSGGAAVEPPARAVMTQKDERFSPHVLPIVRGTTVDFPNEDAFYHNVFSLSRLPKEFDLGRYPRGDSKSQTFTKTGIVQVFCHIHSDMNGFILVLGNRYYTVPVAGGKYTIDGVPPGQYTVIGWHERIKPVRHTVRVTEGGTAHVDFNIPLPPTAGRQ